MGMNGEKSDVDVGVVDVGFGVLVIFLELVHGDELAGLFDDIACYTILVEENILLRLTVHLIVLGKHEAGGADIA